MTAQEKFDSVKRLREFGWTLARIGNQFGWSRQRVHQILNPSKHRARVIVQRWRNLDRLKVPGKCVICGRDFKKLECHHPDYRFPLKVMWVCHGCHPKLKSKSVELSECFKPLDRNQPPSVKHTIKVSLVLYYKLKEIYLNQRMNGSRERFSDFTHRIVQKAADNLVAAVKEPK